MAGPIAIAFCDPPQHRPAVWSPPSVNGCTLRASDLGHAPVDGATKCCRKEAIMRTFVFNHSYSDDCRPMAHLPVGTVLMGCLFAANMISAILSLLAIS
jgi:hypothetical protein